MECARILHRRRATLLMALCCGIIVAALISFVQPRLYQSQASIEFQGVNENFLNLRDIYPTAALSADSNGAYIQTQAEILQQDALIERVAEKTPPRRAAGITRSGLSPWDKFRQITGAQSFVGAGHTDGCRGSEKIISRLCPRGEAASSGLSARHATLNWPPTSRTLWLRLHRTEHRGAAADRSADSRFAEPATRRSGISFSNRKPN